MNTVLLKGEKISLKGSLPEIGSIAPDFTLTGTDLKDIKRDDFKGKFLVLNIFPSLDTFVCACSVNNFNQMAKIFPDLNILSISADLPFAQKQFCNRENIENVITGSVFREPEFGQRYGVLMTDGPLRGLLSRAVVLIDPYQKIIYTEQVKELTHEPNYDAVKNTLIHYNK